MSGQHRTDDAAFVGTALALAAPMAIAIAAATYLAVMIADMNLLGATSSGASC